MSKLDVNIETEDKQVQTLREKQQTLLREKDKLDYQIQTVDERIKKVEELEVVNQKELLSLKTKKSEFKKATLDLNILLNKDSGLAITLASTRKELLALREAYAKLETKNTAIKENISGNLAVTKILENKKAFPGVFGTIAELGEVRSTYALALETAAGPRIKSLVVKDDSVAAACILYLKEHKLGTASFLPLNKIKPAQPDTKIEKLAASKGVCGLAISLIEYDKEYKNVFSYVFGNTLIVDNIHVARRLGIGEARMATLDGDLCELSGVMIGGFRHQKKGAGFREKELTADISNIGEKIVSTEITLQKFEVDKKQNEDTISRIREFKANLEGDIIKAEKALHLESTDLDASLAFKSELIVQSKDVDKQLTTLSDTIMQKNRTLAQLKTEKQKLRDAISQLKNPAVLAQLNAFDAKKTELNTRILHTNATIQNITIQINDILKRDEENIIRTIKEQVQEEIGASKEIGKLVAQTQHSEKQLGIQEEKQTKFYATSKQFYDKRNQLQDSINKTEAEIYRTEEDSRQVEYHMNVLSLQEAKIKAELAGIESEFEQYRSVELDMEKSEEELKKEIDNFEKMREHIGNVNLKSLEIYDAVEKEYNVMHEKKNVLHTEKGSVLNLMAQIESAKKGIFMKNFENVNLNFQKIFTDLSTKGVASLELENLQDPLSEGMLIKVKLTGNKFMDIRSLSG
ncbi:MAG: hypothetical protein AABX52_03180, partial [Nanoarchaeota archaeon]